MSKKRRKIRGSSKKKKSSGNKDKDYDTRKDKGKDKGKVKGKEKIEKTNKENIKGRVKDNANGDGEPLLAGWRGAVAKMARNRAPELVFGLVLTVLVVAAVYYFVVDEDKDTPHTEYSVGIERGLNAPNFHLTDTDGNSFSLNDLHGNVVVLDFMATWCSPCVAEMDELKQLEFAYAGRGLEIVSIDTDSSETDEMLESFRDEHGCNWRFAARGQGVWEDYKYGDNPGIPTLYIIDRDGDVAYRGIGGPSENPYSKLSAEIEKVI